MRNGERRRFACGQKESKENLTTFLTQIHSNITSQSIRYDVFSNYEINISMV